MNRTINFLLCAIFTTTLFFAACDSSDEEDNKDIDYMLVALGKLDGEPTDFSFRYRENWDGSPWNSLLVMGDSLIVDLQGENEYVIRGVKSGFISNLDYDTVAVTDEVPVQRLEFVFQPE